MRLHDLAYLAGLIDGEGCITSYWDKRNLRVRITVVNTDKKMVDWCKAHFGGYIHQRRFRAKNWKDCYCWIRGINREDGNFIKSLLPFLITKKKQVEIIQDYILTGSTRGHRINEETREKRYYYYKQLKKLNSTGNND